jgi:mono/diheme cytochrome c family protein
VPPQFAASRRLFDQQCAKCHAIGGGGAAGAPPAGGPPMAGGPGKPGGPGGMMRRGPDLSTVGRDPAHTVDWLMEHVRNPKAHKPDSKMPPFDENKISDQDLRTLAEYLASLK